MRTLLLAMLCVLSIAANAQIRSVSSGNWSDSTTWGGTIPGSADKVIISKEFEVTFNLEAATIAGLQLEGTLSFNPDQSSTLQSSKNVVVTGLLKMRPSSGIVVHTLRFVNVDESKFVGGGMDVMDTDVGLWVVGSGQLELIGTHKGKGWTNTQASVSKGSSTILLKDQVKWDAEDEIVVTPTEAPTSTTFYNSFDELKIAAISGTQITTKSTTKFTHPAVRNKWTAEVLNLTRNVRIEGTEGGRTHVLIRSTKPQQVSWVQFRHVGPRKNRNADTVPDMIPGRYGFHFHHSMDGSRGTVLVGNVIRDCGNHGFVPHTSHGITYKDNISYNTFETPYWWDPGHISHDVIYDGNVAAKVGYVWRSAGLDGTGISYGSEGFSLGMGLNNVANNNVVVGQQCKRNDMLGAYVWQANNEGMWEFKNNLAHNGTTGIRIWQNTGLPHVIENFSAYYNNLAVFHGAYLNSFRYVGGFLYGNAFQLRAGSMGSYALRIENMEFDGGGIVNSPLVLGHGKITPSRPVLIRNVKFLNYLKGAVSYEATGDSKIKLVDFVNCSFGTRDFVFPYPMLYKDIIRVQPASGQPFQVTRSGRTSIKEFAPKVWGTGTGLATEFFKMTNLTSPVVRKIEPVVFLQVLADELPYTILDRMTFSARWNGQVMAQYTESYKFHLSSGGGHRLWVNGKLVLDSWQDKHPNLFNTVAIPMVAGTKYSLKLEYFNEKTIQSKAMLSWSSARTPNEVIPQSQLYPAPIELFIDDGMGHDTVDHDAMGHGTMGEANTTDEASEEGIAFEKNPSKNLSKVSVFPVPSTGSVTVSSTRNDLKNTRIEILNSAGSIVHEVQGSSGNMVKLNLQHLKNGVYFLSIKAKDKAVMHQIVIQK